jgi:hypothetical protein
MACNRDIFTFTLPEDMLVGHSIYHRNFLWKSCVTCQGKCHRVPPCTEKSDKNAQRTPCITDLFYSFGREGDKFYSHNSNPSLVNWYMATVICSWRFSVQCLQRLLFSGIFCLEDGCNSFLLNVLWYLLARLLGVTSRKMVISMNYV